MSDNKYLEQFYELIQKQTGLAKDEQRPVLQVDRFSTGSMKLDLDLWGGYDMSGLTTLSGPKGSGKTLLCMLAIAALQRRKPGAKVLFIDTEGTDTKPERFAACGINIEDVVFLPKQSLVQTQKGLRRWMITGEFIFDTIKSALLGPNRNDPDWKCPFDLIILDSYQGVMWEAELDGDVTDANMKRNIWWTRMLKMIMYATRSANVPFILTTQAVDNFNKGTMGPDKEPGGVNAIDHNSTLWIWLSPPEAIKSGDEVVGRKLKYRTIKSKISPYIINSKEITIRIDSNQNVVEPDYITEAYEVAIALGIFTKANGVPSYNGNSKYFNGEQLGANELAIKKNLAENTELFSAVYLAIQADFDRRKNAILEGNFAAWGNKIGEENEVD